MTTSPVMLGPVASITPEGLAVRPHVTSQGVLQQLMLVPEARAFLLSPEAKSPRDWQEWTNLSAALFLVERYDEALDAGHIAVRHRRTTTTLLNLAIILETFGRFDESDPIAREASLMDPTDELAGGLYADSLIRRAQWHEGWPIYTRYHHGLERLREAIPEWPGEDEAPIAGRRVLVVEGGGFGDNLLFLRWLPRLAELGARITLVAPRGLVPLLRGFPGVDRVIPNLRGDAAIRPADYDYFVPLLTLGRHFDITVESLAGAWRGPYIHADRDKARDRNVYGATPHVTPVIGVCWRAGEGAYPVRYRTLSPAQLDRLLRARVPRGVRWVSLQYDETPPPSPPSLVVDSPAIADWSDTAAIVANLDLVVTVDTGVAHLAGAMGVPVWVMLPGRCSWPFLLRRDDSPLYPSARVFRNGGIGIDRAVNAAISALESLP